jgi:pyruvate,water dikinase
VFTSNPNNATSNDLIVEASFGLGESVVSGDVTPDRFIIARDTLAVSETVIGNKSHVVRALGDVNAYDPRAESLNAKQLRELAELSLQVEKYFGAPVDLEWGWADGRFILLQARPIRGLEIARDVEACRTEEIMRLRASANGSRRVWVTHNLGETLPLPTPMTWDVVRHFMSGSGGFGRMYRDFGYRPSARILKHGFLELICGRIYADPARTAELFWEGMPMEYDLDLLLRDKSALDSPPSKFNPDKAGGDFLLRLPGTLIAMLSGMRRIKKMRRETLARFEKTILPRYLGYVSEKRAQDLTLLSLVELHREFHERRRVVLDEFGGESLKPGFFGGMARANLEGLLVQLAGETEGKHLAMELTMGLDGDLTVEQNETLFRVARNEVRMEDFIARFGHRTAGEMELAEPRWREDQTHLHSLVDLCCGDASRDPAEMHRVNSAKRKDAEALLPGVLEKFGGSSLTEDIHVELRDAQALLPYRENGKFYLMMGYELIRQSLLEYARRWNLGRDVFFLNLDEVERYESERERLNAEIARRKVRWQASRRLELADVIDSADLENLGKPKEYAAAEEFEGDSIASGVYTGKARIVFDPKEASHCEAGFVLVCPSTDPGWTALFMRAKGLVIERGGVLSHGAIVARDFGIPAVVCSGATRRIKDGTTVRVDGNRGRITVLHNGHGNGA